MPDSVNYQQPDYVEKRVRYFDGQYLKVQDFVNEQQYHIDRLRRHHRFLVVSGIVDGLTVTAKANSAGVTISAGTAIDKEGRQILLNKSYLFNDEGFPKAGETTSNTPGVELDLQSYKDKGDCNLFIVYDERETDQQSEGGSQNDTRFHERPNFEVIPVNQPQSDQGILLAKLKITADKVEVNSSVRQYSGLRLPGAETSEVTLRYQGDKNSKLAVLTGSLSVTGNVGIGTTNPGSSKLKIAQSDSDFVDFAFYKSGMGQLQVIGWSGGWNINTKINGKHLYFNRDAGENSDVYIGRNGHELFVKGKNGNVGIGATDPKEKLEVAGNLKFSSDGNGIEFFGGAKIFKKIGSGLKIQAHDDTQGVEFLKKDGLTSIMVLKDGDVGIGTTDPKAKLAVNTTENHLQLRRDKTETTSGKRLFLELWQDDDNPPKVAEVHPSIRFHHSHRYWHRIEAKKDGFHFKDGNLSSDNYVWIFAANTIHVGMIVMWSGKITEIPSGWALCNGKNGTPNLTDKFIIAAGSKYSVGSTGGLERVTLSIQEIPRHNHSGQTNNDGTHRHIIPVDQGGGDGLGWSSPNAIRATTSYFDNSGSPGTWAVIDSWAYTKSNEGNHSHSLSTDYQGNNTSHENMPPYYALCFIIKL